MGYFWSMPEGIVVEPLAGLCNRMRTIDGALSLGERTGLPVHVRWGVRGDMGARFDQLFEVPDSFASLEQFVDRPWTRLPRLAVVRARCGRYVDTAAVERQWVDGTDPAAFTGHGTLYLRTYHRVEPSVPPFRDFRPVAAIREQVAALGDLGHHVGVHIRRTDHVDAIRSSPTSGFVACMQAELDADPDTRFFVATDEPAEEAHLRDAFPGRIVTHPKRSYARRDPQAIVDAAVDLYALAGCRSIIGSGKSSFSATAGWISGIRVVVAT